MKPLTDADSLGLVPVPLRDASASSSSRGCDRRLTTDKLGSEPATSTGTARKIAFLAIVLTAVAVSFAAVPVSHAIHRHLHH